MNVAVIHNYHRAQIAVTRKQNKFISYSQSSQTKEKSVCLHVKYIRKSHNNNNNIITTTTLPIATITITTAAATITTITTTTIARLLATEQAKMFFFPPSGYFVITFLLFKLRWHQKYIAIFL